MVFKTLDYVLVIFIQESYWPKLESRELLVHLFWSDFLCFFIDETLVV